MMYALNYFMHISSRLTAQRRVQECRDYCSLFNNIFVQLFWSSFCSVFSFSNIFLQLFWTSFCSFFSFSLWKAICYLWESNWFKSKTSLNYISKPIQKHFQNLVKHPRWRFWKYRQRRLVFNYFHKSLILNVL